MSESNRLRSDVSSRVSGRVSASLPWILVLTVLSLWLSNWYLISRFVDDSRRGQFGDQFGAVNALFSGLAFAGLISAIFLQKRELALQREQLELQREEMRESRLQLAEQARVQEGSRRAAIASLKIEVLKTRINMIDMQMGHYSEKTAMIQQIKEETAIMEAIVRELEG